MCMKHFFVIQKSDYNGISNEIYPKGRKVLVGLANRITKAQGPGRHTASCILSQESGC